MTNTPNERPITSVGIQVMLARDVPNEWEAWDPHSQSWTSINETDLKWDYSVFARPKPITPEPDIREKLENIISQNVSIGFGNDNETGVKVFVDDVYIAVDELLRNFDVTSKTGLAE